MKLTTLAVLISLAASGSAFAQTTPGSTNPNQSANASTSGTTSTLAQNSQRVAPYGQPAAEETHAQVYQQLVHSEQDGHLAYLNKTLYAHH